MLLPGACCLFILLVELVVDAVPGSASALALLCDVIVVVGVGAATDGGGGGGSVFISSHMPSKCSAGMIVAASEYCWYGLRLLVVVVMVVAACCCWCCLDMHIVGRQVASGCQCGMVAGSACI